MSDSNGKDWLDFYRAAILELDPEKLPKLIEAAHTLVQKRLREVWQDGKDPVESRKLLDALQNLEVLRRG
ncbi:MAG: hypothetical protein M3O09_17685 [Acidobacteriota bacterium]|nr:hypothetical protein [Acidobacteriota bacterium]